MSSTDSNPGVWDFGQVALYLALGESTVKTNYRRWGIPFVRIGKLIRFRQEDIDRWLDERVGAAEVDAP